MNGEKDIKDFILKSVEAVKNRALNILEVEGPKSIRKNFEAGGRPNPWVKSKKPKRWSGTKTLVRRGNLMKVSAVKNINEVSVTLITNPQSRAYAKIHHEGGTINMPARNLRFRVKKYKDGSKRTVFASRKTKKIKMEKVSRPYTIKIPARPFMTVPEEDLTKIIRLINK